MTISASIVLDSVNAANHRLVTFKLRYPHFIHPQVLMHRMFSRSCSSSRAIPTTTLAGEVLKDPVIFEEIASNKPGMQPGEALGEDDSLDILQILEEHRNFSVLCAQRVARLGLHKQWANRFLELHSHISVVLTTTVFPESLENMFALRCAGDAQSEFQVLAWAMRRALDDSTPTLLQNKEWHIPFVTSEERASLELHELLEVSAARCARTSYNKHDLSDPIVAEDKKLANRLRESKHCYDEKTEVFTSDGFIPFSEIGADTLIADIDERTGAFMGWTVPMDIVVHEYSGNMFHYNTPDVDLLVTDRHKLIAMPVSTASDRYAPISLQAVIPADKPSEKCAKERAGEREMRMLPAVAYVKEALLPEYKLLGFYIGDGYFQGSTLTFHLKKPRKIEYLLHLLKELNLGYTESAGWKGALKFSIPLEEGLCNWLKHSGGISAQTKTLRLGLPTQQEVYSVFDGLKNSDGTLKRNTWVYYTTSDDLVDSICRWAPFIGLVPIKVKRNQGHQIYFRTKSSLRVNDPRTPRSQVSVYDSWEGRVYCVTVPHGALLVRRNGKTVISGNCNPFEHQAKAQADCLEGFLCGNFVKGWHQYRKVLEQKGLM